MRSYLMIVFSIIVFIALNYGIYQKQKVKDHGEVILLELAPVDPRSLMQGDYMRLRYAIERPSALPQLQRHQNRSDQKRGYLVIKADKDNVAQFVRFYSGEQLGTSEKRVRFHRENGIRIVPDSFLFQEGHSKYYEDAKYGVFKFDDVGKYLLVGLADENGEEIVVD